MARSSLWREIAETLSDEIAQGLYGQCADCGAEIAPARLQAWPTALRCVACQTRAETPH